MYLWVHLERNVFWILTNHPSPCSQAVIQGRDHRSCVCCRLAHTSPGILLALKRVFFFFSLQPPKVCQNGLLMPHFALARQLCTKFILRAEEMQFPPSWCPGSCLLPELYYWWRKPSATPGWLKFSIFYSHTFLFFETYGNCIAWASQTVTYEPHREGDARPQPQSRPVQHASFVCSDWYNYTFSDILGPDHPQEAPLSRNRSVHYTIYAKWTNGHSQIWDPLYPQSGMRREYCSLCQIHHLGMKSFQFRKFLKKQKKELHLCRAASTLFIRGLVGGKDTWRYLKGCIQTAGGRQGQLSVGRWVF